MYELQYQYSSGTYTHKVLYDFCHLSQCSDGATPEGALIIDTNGNLYGVTNGGGSENGGTIFELSPPSGGGSSWTLHTLHNFCSQSGCTDGVNPSFGLTYVGASSGPYNGTSALYGSTQFGGQNADGLIYSLSSPTGTFSALYNFCPGGGGTCPDGKYVNAVIADSSGNLYGTTATGGAQYGTVFELKASGSFTTLYSFCSGGGSCADGAVPTGPLVLDFYGNLLGTTNNGGAYGYGGGAIFKIVPNGISSTESVVHSFCGGALCADGKTPGGGLWTDGSGTYYGENNAGGGYGYGTLFALSGTTLTTLYQFCASGSPCTDGSLGPDGVIGDGSGNIFGTRWHGGPNNGGVVFEVTP